ncbi:hypothetical protein B7C62_24300 [Kitasatospora albolonga]|uniref:Uncharacterized protein n=1 Tax=Kitasatospora albolonga TaxID=68173 RepID=A0ABC8BX74_9ACTN|nr:hypothetical protein B7C62_24300 [Kitasatospora albolonga]
MPGQRKRKRQQRVAGRGSLGAGRWEVLLETQDESEWHAHLRLLRAGRERIDWSMTRVDTCCGRLMQATTYRLSLFVPGPGPGPGGEQSGP